MVLCFMALTVSAAQVRILPFHINAVYSRDRSNKPWSALIHAVDGKRAYQLFFDEEHDARGTLCCIHLVLNDGMGRHPNLNLLRPKGNWHGLQPYDFVASDFLQGIDKSAFGRHRTINVERKGIVVQIEVLEVKVNPVPGGEPEIGGLTLSVNADNLNN